MKLIFAVAAGVAALSLGACATTSEEGASRQELVDAGQLTGDRTDGGRVRCEQIRVTGSRMSERICLTEREWSDMEERAQQVRRDRDEQHTVSVPGQNSGPSR